MVQGYYTLEEAARILGLTAEELNQMRERHEVRAFADRGTWRFRTQDIEEMARRRGLGSSPELPLGEAPKPRPHDSPAPKSDPSVFEFNLGSDQVEIGHELPSKAGSKVSSKSGPKSKGGTPRSPTPKPGSDSDVRLVAEGSDLSFKVSSDSDVRVASDSSIVPKSGVRKTGPRPDSGEKLVGERRVDSDVKLSSPDKSSDSDVRIVSDSTDDLAPIGGQPPKRGSDSDVRLESTGPVKKGTEDSFLTEEIDLDAELRKAEEAAKAKKEGPGSKVKEPGTAPFGLAEPRTPVRKEVVKGAPGESSSDFDLSLDPKAGSSLEISSGELKSLGSARDDEVSLGEIERPGGRGDSGINLQEPADSGISLEQDKASSEEIEFELSLEAESTPKPAKAKPNVDSSSEFELTLDDSANLAPLEEEKAPTSGEKDIFETDFEVPALEDSGSQAEPLGASDTDLESSDFDLALGDEDAAAEEESGSQVVALEDEADVDEGAATIARPCRSAGAGVADDEAQEGLLGEEELEEGEPVAGRRPVLMAAPPADWGLLLPITLLVSVFFMFIVGIISFELLRGMWGYHAPGKASAPIVRGIAGMIYDAKDIGD